MVNDAEDPTSRDLEYHGKNHGETGRDKVIHRLLGFLHRDTTAADPVRGDVIVAQGATPKWARYGFVPAATAILRNAFVGDNGDTEPTYKATLDATNPTTIVIPNTAAPGTSLIYAHRDHAHGEAAHDLLGAAHGDSVAQAVSRGSLVYGNSTPKWDELVIGSANKVLHSDGTDASWQSLASADMPFVNHMFAAHKGAAAQSVNSGAVTVLTFDNEDFDPGSAFASNVYTIPVTGKYFLQAQTVVLMGIVLSTLFTISIYVNNAEVRRTLFGQESVTANFLNLAVSATLSLTAADTVDIRVSQNSGGALNFNGAAATTDQFFSGFRVS